MATAPKKRVCIVGAGPCGLTTIKQLRDEGLDVVAYDNGSNVGGIWNRESDDKKAMKVFDSLYLTISAKLMAYSDFMPPGERAFWTHAQYQEYLEEYAHHYDLYKHCKLNKRVVKVVKTGEKWHVTAQCVKTGAEETDVFDALAVASGAFQHPKPLPENLSGFTGEVHHSSSYRNNADFKGKRMLILGLAESGADLVREISDVSSECTLSIRSRSFLLPRLFNGVASTDKGTWRTHHYDMHGNREIDHGYHHMIHGKGLTKYIFYPACVFYSIIFCIFCFLRDMFTHKRELYSGINNLQQPLYPLKMDINTPITEETIQAINDWNAKAHNGEATWAPKIIFAKNVSWIPNMVAGKFVVNDTGISHAEGNKVFFKNGDIKEFDAVMLCIGFEKQFTQWGPDTAVKDNNVRTLYKHSIHPDHKGSSLAYIGWVRPYTGGIPIIAEMQARYWGGILSGRLTIPKDLNERIAKEKNWEDYWGKYSPHDHGALPSQAMFCDDLATEIGCMPTAWDMILNPRLMVQLMVSPYNQACYRIKGPHALGKKAWDELMWEYPYVMAAVLAGGISVQWILDLVGLDLRPKHLPLFVPPKSMWESEFLHPSVYDPKAPKPFKLLPKKAM
eukprot:CAMPEP_0170142882 /NCGR_PEP_ID=MMETSP0033_2-20121228/8937_1 /TAXON_ID=195969 /ORGANISM="Dolichomastix tenuilepis, Strain CCMP3274" /LENGTH=616 /DNA_ID=CAMNT_0010379275 /DNA_START=19 /DNA_END=1869 /DNA_ORIENTATION=+